MFRNHSKKSLTHRSNGVQEELAACLFDFLVSVGNVLKKIIENHSLNVRLYRNRLDFFLNFYFIFFLLFGNHLIQTTNYSERSEAEGQAESWESDWEKQKWMKGAMLL